MPAKPRTIDVYPNPYSGIDADGVPQGVVQMPGTRNYIGAFIDHVACRATRKNKFYFQAPNEAKNETGIHGLRKQSIPFTPEVARAVFDGGLIVASPKDAALCGIAESDFQEPEKQLEAERARATAECRAERLDPSFELQKVPLERTLTDEERRAAEAKAGHEEAKPETSTSEPTPQRGSANTRREPTPASTNETPVAPGVSLRTPEES